MSAQTTKALKAPSASDCSLDFQTPKAMYSSMSLRIGVEESRVRTIQNSMIKEDLAQPDLAECVSIYKKISR